MDKLDRRAALTLAATLGAAGGLIMPTLAMGQAKGGGDEEEVTANEDLMREHGVLRRILVLYREVAPNIQRSPAGVDAKAIHTAATLFKAFGEQYHEQMLEEQFVFPAVRKAGGKAASLPDILVAQHARGREITDYIIDATKSGRIGTANAEPLARTMVAFSRMYEVHAAREDTVVFPAFKKSMPKAQFEELGERFEAIERKQFGGDGFDMALDKVMEAEAALGLADLAKFTAPPPGSR